MKNAVMLWTGGKDCALALHRSLDKYSIQKLVTFVPSLQPTFYAHNIQLMEIQARAIGITHEKTIIREPYRESYRSAFLELKNNGTEVLITGDISTVDGHSNWIKEIADGLIDIDQPLWEVDRYQALQDLLKNKFEIICSLSRKAIFELPLAGRIFDEHLIKELRSRSQKSDLDVCGENGEYHTMVLNAPYFDFKIELSDTKIMEKDDFHYLTFEATSS